ncbi:ABC transporter permease [Grimontia kaedaensis]|uniref:Transport permease protein n=1 Tax=Grimontia kaedaensis TaxID=2872157 RepID=A0ABY4WW88_9GAMM|nr:ABC transporter permease [Grimontia kaedaensis]USH03259.1 ABC transporter permease [Grimontia kaedaensis]
MFKSIYGYRFYIVSAIKADYKTRYARSKLGLLWAILQPLAMVSVYAFILSNILTAKLPGVATQYAYPIYILSGVIAWTLFSEVVTRMLSVFIDNASLIKKMNFPKVTLPVVVTGSALVNYLVFVILSYLVFFLLGHNAFGGLIWLPVLTIILLMFSIGFGLLFGILNVFIRDISQIISILLQFWFWFTPIVYMTSIIPNEYHNIIYINPMVSIVEGYQEVMLYNASPNLVALLYPVTVSIVLLLLSLFVYKKAKMEMADVL